MCMFAIGTGYKSPAVGLAEIGDQLATIDKVENWGCCGPFSGGGAGSPSNTLWLGPRPTTTPSFILIHPTVLPQYTNVTDRHSSLI